MREVANLIFLALLLTAGSAEAQNGTNSDDHLLALKPEQCGGTWQIMMGESETSAQAGAVTENAAIAQVDTDFAQVDTSNDGTINKKEFETACRKGLVHGPRRP
jgi:hypothetical protein